MIYKITILLFGIVWLQEKESWLIWADESEGIRETLREKRLGKSQVDGLECDGGREKSRIGVEGNLATCHTHHHQRLQQLTGFSVWIGVAGAAFLFVIMCD